MSSAKQVSARAGRDHRQSPKVCSARSHQGVPESLREALGPVSAHRGQMMSFSSHKLLSWPSVKQIANK